jgi:hypothetical protein
MIDRPPSPKPNKSNRLPRTPPPNIIAVVLPGDYKPTLLARLEALIIRRWQQFRERA